MCDALALLKALDVTPEELERLKMCRAECKIDCLLEHYNKIKDELDAMKKAQESVKPKVAHDGWYRCGNCNNSLASSERVKHFYGHPWPKYCEKCGRAVKW